jgi:hypothetical protein
LRRRLEQRHANGTHARKTLDQLSDKELVETYLRHNKNPTCGSVSAEKRDLESEAPMASDAFQTSGNSPTHSGNIPPDFVVEDHGSIFLLKPLTPPATSWVEDHIGQENAYQPYLPTVVVEHRYIADIVAGIQNDGLAVQA